MWLSVVKEKVMISRPSKRRTLSRPYLINCTHARPSSVSPFIVYLSESPCTTLNSPLQKTIHLYGHCPCLNNFREVLQESVVCLQPVLTLSIFISGTMVLPGQALRIHFHHHAVVKPSIPSYSAPPANYFSGALDPWSLNEQ